MKKRYTTKVMDTEYDTVIVNEGKSNEREKTVAYKIWGVWDRKNDDWVWEKHGGNACMYPTRTEALGMADDLNEQSGG